MFNFNKDIKAERDKAKKETRTIYRLLRERDERIVALTAKVEILQKERDLAEVRANEAHNERRRVIDKLLVLTGCGSLFDATAVPELPMSTDDGKTGEYTTNMREFVSAAEMQLQKELAETKRRNSLAEERDKEFKAKEEEIATSPVEEEIPA